jgi:hypothetical protein
MAAGPKRLAVIRQTCTISAPGLTSEFERKTFADFIDPLLKRIKSGMYGLIVEIKDIAASGKRKHPVVGLHIGQYQFDRVPRGADCT